MIAFGPVGKTFEFQTLLTLLSILTQYDRRGDPVVEEEHKRTDTQCTFRRTFRDHTELAPETAMFDTYSNDSWATRHAALGKFAQAARKVKIGRGRVRKKKTTSDI